jgi:hypothetical protein
LAHHQPAHLARLVAVLDHSDCTFFVHIDGKVADTAFRGALGERRNVFFVENRYAVNWGGYSQVQATLALLSAARGSGSCFHRYCLLSGSDYPIQSNPRIQAEFASGKEFMRIDRRIGASEDNSHCRNVMFYWCVDNPEPGVQSGTVRRDPYSGIGLYHGAQWWALTHECVEYILRFLAAHADYEAFFRQVLCPDEIFFHSIVKASPFASRITHDFEAAADAEAFSLSNEHGCHYIDWNAKGEDRLPKVLDLADLDRLRSSEALFARKFQEARSAALVSRLDRMLAGVE